MWAVLAVAALGLAVLVAPNGLVEQEDPSPPPEAVTRAAALGRTFAAADLIWLRTVQIIGDGPMIARRWPQLEHWVDLSTRLDPAFETPYFFGAVLLAGDRERAHVTDALLERGQRALPNVYSLPMMRGYIAYFSRMDPAAAAVHYATAAQLPGAPRFLGKFAATLEKQAVTCSAMARDLEMLARVESPDKRNAMLAEREGLLISCVEGQLKNAAAAYRNSHEGRNGTLKELQDAGLVESELFAPPGRCWTVKGGRGVLVPCPGNGSRP